MKSKRVPTGRVFRRPYFDRQGLRCHTATWYIRYYVNGKAVQLANGTENYEEALAILRDKMAGLASAQAYSDRPERVTMNQLFDLVIDLSRMRRNASQNGIDCSSRTDCAHVSAGCRPGR